MKESTASDPIAMDCSEDTDSPWYAETSSVSGPTKADPVHPMCTSSIPACARLIGQLHIMIVGDSCVGKTQFAHRLLREIELAFGSKTEIRSGDTYSLMGGHPELRQDAPPFEMTEYRASTAYTILWPVVSDNGHTSLPNASSWPSKSAPVYSVTVLDTRGYGETTNAVEAMTRVTTYLEQAFVNTQAIYASSTPHHNFYRLLSPGFGIHELVDVVLYLSHAIKPVDIVYMRRFKPFACVVPVSVIDGIAEPLDARCGMCKSSNILLPDTRVTQIQSGGCDEDKQDTMLPFVINGRVNTDVEDFNRLCNLLFRPSKLDRLRYWNVCKFVEWLSLKQEKAVKLQEEEVEKKKATGAAAGSSEVEAAK
ncbi:hypothetical protein BC936DRAFT_146104 [Jimgerdemannia flammicorona]|uniref:P-loop containing nucleoside triphosphate hydrolase protein n=1 Tax=Jimgerdemannia flammicorona TaxID=994334 RepID=A0A433D8G9_9FUNG|nr:hypothetical protein BC936DRAFT_146104 [Jimgerdemannia flammicorona]